MMRYRLIFYNRTTDRVGGLIDIPANLLPQVLALAGIQNASDLGEYPLAPKQVLDIASLIGFKPDVSRFAYHLEPLGLDPPDRLRAWL
jgi:hypothetical protein